MSVVMEYNLIFRGEVEEGYDIPTTKKKLANAFKVSDEKIDVLFSGQPTVIKKRLSFESGVKLQQQLLTIGAKTDLELSEIKQSPSISAKSRTNILPVVSANPVKKIELALQPVQDAAPQVEEESTGEIETGKESRFNFAQMSLFLKRTLVIIFLLLGIACLIVYSPFSDQVIRIGFLLGGLLVFLSYRKLRQ